MAEYLKRDDVLSNADILTVQTKEYGTIDVVSVEYIADLPTADVEEARHGEWLLRHVGHGHYWECSVCHTNPCIYVTEDTKFCPNCGTKMDGKQVTG